MFDLCTIKKKVFTSASTTSSGFIYIICFVYLLEDLGTVYNFGEIPSFGVPRISTILVNNLSKNQPHISSPNRSFCLQYFTHGISSKKDNFAGTSSVLASVKIENCQVGGLLILLDKCPQASR